MLVYQRVPHAVDELKSRSSGCLSVCFPGMNFASNGIYAMIGAAAMLASFKQMSVACVLFISSWVANWGLVE